MDLIETAQQYMLPNHLQQSQDRDSRQSNNNDSNQKKFHAICANGRSKDNLRYYDRFATVLFPGVLLGKRVLFPDDALLRVDLIPERYKNIEKKFMAVVNSNFRNDDIPKTMMKKKRQSNSNNNKTMVLEEQQPISVRSCFNGLTLYRADVWLTNSCRYDTYHKDDLAFVGRLMNHTCEHVVFHECLRRTMMLRRNEVVEGYGEGEGEEWSISVKPDLITTWHGRKEKIGS